MNSVLLSFLTKWQSSPALYYILKTDIKTFTITSGTKQLNNESVITGLMPYRVIIGFVTSKAYGGDRELNPFAFKHHNIQSVNLLINGEQCTAGPIECDFTNNQYLEAYKALFNGLNLDEAEPLIDFKRQNSASLSATVEN